MKITLDRIDDNYLFECKNELGTGIFLNNTSDPNAKGVSPMQAILMAVAGCSGIDVVSILKKQRQQITRFSASVEGDRVPEDEAKPFSKIEVTFLIDGEVDPQKAYKAAQLSFDKYCSVSKTLEPKVEIGFQVIVNGNRVEV